MVHIDLNFIGGIIVFLSTRTSNTLNLPHAIIKGCSALGNWNLGVTGWVKRTVPLLRSLGRKKKYQHCAGGLMRCLHQGIPAELLRYRLNAAGNLAGVGDCIAVNWQIGEKPE